MAASARSIASPTAVVAPVSGATFSRLVGRKPREPEGAVYCRLEWMRSSVLLGIDRVRASFGPACFLFELGRLGGFRALCRLRGCRDLLGMRLLVSAHCTRFRGLSSPARRPARPLLAVGVGCQFGALFLDLCPQALGLDLRLDLLQLEVGFLFAAIGLSSRLGSVAVCVTLGLLESSFAGELLVAGGVACYLLSLSGNLADETARRCARFVCLSQSFMPFVIR